MKKQAETRVRHKINDLRMRAVKDPLAFIRSRQALSSNRVGLAFVSLPSVPTRASKTTPINTEGPPYGRRRTGKPTAAISNFGLEFFPEERDRDRESRELRDPLSRRDNSRVDPVDSTDGHLRPGHTTAGPRRHFPSPLLLNNPPSSTPCCALPFPVTQSHNIGNAHVVIAVIIPINDY
ncbi:hypothetical protein M8J77_001415 [Diaphorina citri]|nr:hypothetical protein M8J77_001415 [Diaphorina citri]